MIVTKLNRLILYDKPLNGFQIDLINDIMDTLSFEIKEYMSNDIDDIKQIKVNTNENLVSLDFYNSSNIVNIKNQYVIKHCNAMNSITNCPLFSLDRNKRNLSII